MSAADVTLFRTALDHLLRHGLPGGSSSSGQAAAAPSRSAQPAAAAPAAAPSSPYSLKSRNVPGRAVLAFLDL